MTTFKFGGFWSELKCKKRLNAKRQKLNQLENWRNSRIPVLSDAQTFGDQYYSGEAI